MKQEKKQNERKKLTEERNGKKCQQQSIQKGRKRDSVRLCTANKQAAKISSNS